MRPEALIVILKITMTYVIFNPYPWVNFEVILWPATSLIKGEGGNSNPIFS